MHLGIVIFQDGESLNEVLFGALAEAGITLNAIIVTDTLKMIGYHNAIHEEARYHLPTCKFIKLNTNPVVYISYLEQAEGEIPMVSVLNFGDERARAIGSEMIATIAKKHFNSTYLAPCLELDISQSLQASVSSRALLQHMEERRMLVNLSVLTFTESWQEAIKEGVGDESLIPLKTFSEKNQN